MIIVKYRKIFYTISALLVILSIVAVSTWGLKWGIDFKGGSILEVSYPEGRPSVEAVRDLLKPLNINESVRPAGDTSFIIRARDLKQEEKNEITKLLSFDNTKKIEEKQFNTIGPILGNEAKRKAYVSIILVMLAIVLFVTFAFRKVSKPVSSWKYGIIAVVALIHDVIIPTGFFAVMGHYFGYEVDTLFVTGLLVILGFSVHDTIVVFDRVRENLRRSGESKDKKTFEQIVGAGISQTFVRSVNTSLTTLLALLALYIWGPDATRHFSLALLVGITAGTYSSIFLGSPLLVTVEKWQAKKK
ncbi:MAG: protein translocase subunit SecF [bacterium]|nr:protein translocase subunit SecF [bacterium]